MHCFGPSHAEVFVDMAHDCTLQGYLREAKCHLAMGEIATAIIAYSKVLQLEAQNSAAKTEVSPACIVCCFDHVLAL